MLTSLGVHVFNLRHTPCDNGPDIVPMSMLFGPLAGSKYLGPGLASKTAPCVWAGPCRRPPSVCVNPCHTLLAWPVFVSLHVGIMLNGLHVFMTWCTCLQFVHAPKHHNPCDNGPDIVPMSMLFGPLAGSKYVAPGPARELTPRAWAGPRRRPASFGVNPCDTLLVWPMSYSHYVAIIFNDAYVCMS